MEIKQEQHHHQQQGTCFIETKRKTPPPLTFPLLKKVKEESIPQNETEEMEMKTDTEIKDAISRIKNSLKSFGSKLRDGGEKLKASLRKYEDELERRNKIKPAVLPVNVPVSAPAEPKSLLLSSPAPPPEPQRFSNTHSVDSVQQMISNGDKKDGASNISSPDRSLAVNKPLSLSESQHGVATSVPTADANKHDSGTDEMIRNILDEVVTVATESVGRNPSASGNDDRPPVTFLKGVFVQQNQEQDIELKTDSEIKETIARLKRNMEAFGHKLHDKGEKIKESIRRYEHELQRRNKIIPGVLPVNIPVSAQVNPTSQLLLRPVSPQECPRSPVTHLVDSVKQMVPTPLTPDWNHLLPPSTGDYGRPLENSYETVDLQLVMKSDRQLNETLAGFKNNLKLCPKLRDGGKKLKENIKRYEDELERRLKGQSMQKIIPGVLPVNIPVSAQVNPTSQLLLRPVSPQECPRSPVTHLVDSVKQMVPTPLTPDWSHLLPPSTGDDGRPLENSYETVDLELVMKSDRQLNETLASFKNNLKLCPKLRDGGQKLKENIKRYEDELERRLKGQSMQKTRPGVSPVNISVSAQVNPTSQLLSKPASPQKCPLSQVTHLVDNVKQVVPNDGIKDGDSNLPSREHVAGNKASPFSGSQYGVAANGLTANADKHDSLTDEKMLKIVRELVTVGIAQTEVGKAAEVCYKDPVKAKVLFALPDHLRKSYVRGFLYPRK